MTATTPAPTLPRPTISGISFGRLLLAEGRKITLGLKTIIMMSLLTVGVVALAVVMQTAGMKQVNAGVNLGALGLPATVMGIILGARIMAADLAVGETQTFFMLEPRRPRHLLAKYTATVLAAVVITVAITVLTAVISGVTALLTGYEFVLGDNALKTLASAALMVTLHALMGAAWASLTLNPGGAVTIVILGTIAVMPALLMLPSFWGLPVAWGLYLTTLSVPDAVFDGANVGQAVVGTCVWLVLPAVLGWWRVLRHHS